MAWFTEGMVLQVAQDNQEADACDMGAYRRWSDLRQDQQEFWLKRARDALENTTPLDLSRPLKTRDGAEVKHAHVSEDGLSVIAFVPLWGTEACWPREGFIDGDHPSDLIYAD